MINRKRARRLVLMLFFPLLQNENYENLAAVALGTLGPVTILAVGQKILGSAK
jgi:hypothetical protein